MPRIRTIKPSFWSDEKLGQLHPFVRLTFLGLISAMADDLGRCKGDFRLVKASIWPLDDDISVMDVADHLRRLTECGRILMYSVDGTEFIQIVNWKRHQKIDRPQPSIIPRPPLPPARTLVDGSPNARRTLVEDSSQEAEAEAEGNGMGSGAEQSRSLDESASAPPASLPELPKAAEQLLERFYELPLNRKRWIDVRNQLVAAIAPGVPGPKIRGGIRAKARDPAHLEACCRAVLEDPPNDRDMAIVIVLKKLTDPPPGPSPSEQAAERDRARIALEERYHAELRMAGIAWAKSEPEAYEAIRAEVDAKYSDAPTSGFVKAARDAELAQRCARVARFPPFDDWAASYAN